MERLDRLNIGEGHLGRSRREAPYALVQKPATRAGEGDEYAFEHADGRCHGRAIPTIGYRGMHSFAVAFEDYFVPEENRIGAEGQGFYLQIKGFEGGRTETTPKRIRR